MRKYILLALGWLCSAFAIAQDTTQQIVPGRFNTPAQEQKPYVILISADGFRNDLAEKFGAENLLRLRAGGVTADYLQASYPSLTFPNHYTIVTGLYPAHHGLVNNSFYDEQRQQSYSMIDKQAVTDSSWYGGTPLWVLAEQQGMLSASFYWVGSESAVQGWRPSYYYQYNEKISIDKRIQTVKDWLQLPPDRRPHLISFYLPEVDHALHERGPESPEAREAVLFVDEAIGTLVRTIDSLQLPVNYIFLSDHGMTAVDSSKAIGLPASIDTSKFIIPWGSALLHLYAKNKADIRPAYRALKKEAKSYNVYLSRKMPRQWHFSSKEDRYHRIGDIILVPELPAFFHLGKRPVTNIGYHGFDPFLPDMRASFYAWGPAFKEKMQIPAFENIHVYPLVARLLGLPYSFSIDGRAEVLAPVLK